MTWRLASARSWLIITNVYGKSLQRDDHRQQPVRARFSACSTSAGFIGASSLGRELKRRTSMKLLLDQNPSP
jgi:hypothetical protein